MPLFKPSDFQDIGSGAADLLKGLANDMAQQVCQLYQNSPAGFTGGGPLGNPVDSFNRGLWDSLCGQMPTPTLPPPPDVPFSGGQCCGVNYDVVAKATYASGFEEFGGATVPGKVTGFRKLFEGPPFNAWSIWVQYDATECGGGTGEQVLIFRASTATGVQPVSVVRTDGSPDGCGDPPPVWPNGSLPAANNPRTYSHQPNDGGPPVDVNYNIDFGPTFNGPLVELPDLPNVCVGFELFGVEIDFCTNKGGGEGGISPEDLERLLDGADRTKDIGDDLDDLRRKGDVDADDTGEQEDNAEGDTGELYGILIEITGFPVGTGREFGQPQKFDFGRAYFRRGDFYSEEIPLTTIRQWLPAQPDSTGYTVFLRKNVKANITVIKPKPKT